MCKLYIAGVLLLWEVGMAAAQDSFPVRVVSSLSQTVLAPATPSHCTFWDYDAYCTSSSPLKLVKNVITIEKPDGAILELACTVDRNDRSCRPLPVNEWVQLTSVRGGFNLEFEDENHQSRKQMYHVMNEDISVR